jgi:hypothetical protein
VRDGHESGEEVAACQHQQRPRAQNAELSGQQDRRDQIVDHEGRLADRNEGRDRRERHFRKRRRRDKDCHRYEHGRQREPLLTEG